MMHIGYHSVHHFRKLNNVGGILGKVTIWKLRKV